MTDLLSLKKPIIRRLRGYAFDPSLSLTMDTVDMNDIVFNVRWEDVEPGPVGEYIEVIDYDPTINKFYKPVNLNALYIIAQDGLDPSESNPQFHQQMVYAVAMVTIQNFEKALGRKIIWTPHRVSDKRFEVYVQKLRLYPHAMREPNAYYSPAKKAILFGYFYPDGDNDMGAAPVFTCLSHDIIAHEMTHAILDSIHKTYNNPTNPDVLAFHEAFADIVALFQHFTFPEALKHQIAKTQGDLAAQNLLGQLAQEFGSATGKYGSLRDAIGGFDPSTGTWRSHTPDPADYRTIMEPHERGSILVAAVFEAFLAIYKSRIVDLLRIATEGTGILPDGEISPDLVNRLAEEASNAAGYVLNRCIQALDYCPPVDITFGDFLRAIITADIEASQNYHRNYRLAFTSAFRKRGIYPQDVRHLNDDSLHYPALNVDCRTDKNGKFILKDNPRITRDDQRLLGSMHSFVFEFANAAMNLDDREEIYNTNRDFKVGRYKDREKPILGLHKRLLHGLRDASEASRMTGLAFIKNYAAFGIRPSIRYNGPSFVITGLELVSRAGQQLMNNFHYGTRSAMNRHENVSPSRINQVIISLSQRCGVIFRDGQFTGFYTPSLIEKLPKAEGPEMFEFSGGCTLIFDLDTKKLKYAITKPLLAIDKGKENALVINYKRLMAQYYYRHAQDENAMNEFVSFFGHGLEPFAFLHRH